MNSNKTNLLKFSAIGKNK